jgi:histidinol-phosphatase (PHP family)
MERTCARALELGLPAVAFTEHVDRTPWAVRQEDLVGYEHLEAFVGADGTLTPPELDVEGYLACLDRCRRRFPQLRILAGAELGEPHLHPAAVAGVRGLDRVLGSLHCLPLDGGWSEVSGLFRRFPAAQVLRDYLAELARMVDASPDFAVLAHIDYPVRYWPGQAGPFDPCAFEEEYRHVLRRLAAGGRALEVNTRVPLHPQIVRWWREEGGTAVTFGSDAHEPERLAHGFAAAAGLVEAHGFRPGRHPYDVWTRQG